MIPAGAVYRISSKVGLPPGAELWTFADLAIKGAGKTYAAAVVAEEFVGKGVPIVVLDGIGIWWGLRVGVDGHQGLPVVIFGGAHQDLPIPTRQEKRALVVDEEKLKLMVLAILKGKMSAVLDTSEFSKGMQRRIVAIFVNELYRLNRGYGDRHVFIEEADLWVPQRINSSDEWASASVGAIDDLVRRGGNFNLGCTLISQRPAVVNKDVLTQVNCLVVLRILHKLDKEAVQSWVEEAARPDDPRIKKWYDSLRELENGEAWIWHPQDPEIFERIQFRKRTTLHATREYFRQAKFEQKDVVLLDVGEFVAKYKRVFEPVRAPNPPAPPIQKGSSSGYSPPASTRFFPPLETPPRALESELKRGGVAGPEVPTPGRSLSAEPLQVQDPIRSTSRLASFELVVTRLSSDSVDGQVVHVLKELGGWQKFGKVQ